MFGTQDLPGTRKASPTPAAMTHDGDMECPGRRTPRLRGGHRAGLAVVAALALAVPAPAPAPAGAEEPDDVALRPRGEMFALQAWGCGDTTTAEPACSDLTRELGRRPGMRVRTFDEVTATLPSRLRANCDVGPDDIGWPTRFVRCFDEADTDQSQWLTQGIAGTDEWRTGETPGGDTHWLVATWCWRGSEGIDEADVCDAAEKVRRTRISLIDVERDGYRNVELVEPHPGGARGLLLHAGGAALAGRWLYVADTDRLYVFNLDHFVQEGDGPYQLPVWARYVVADESDRERHNFFSSISVDGSGATPRLVAAEYRLRRRDEALVTAWPLQRDGQLPQAETDVRSIRAWTIDGDSAIDNVQGVAAAGDLFLFAESSSELERVRAGVPRAEADRCVEWGGGTGEDLYASKRRDLLVGINEGFLATGSAFWGVSYRHAFGLAAPPEGYPDRKC